MATRQKSRRTAGRGAKKTATRRTTRGTTTARRPSRPAASRARTNGHGGMMRERSKPETLRLKGAMPTFTVNDIEKSVAWYTEGLGFMVTERWEDAGKLEGVMLKAGDVRLGLSQDDFSKGRDRQKGVGFRIWAETAQDVDALAERIRAYGGRIFSEPNDSMGSRNFGVEDPDGFRISFSKTR